MKVNNFKAVTAITLIFVLIFSLTACSSNSGSSANTANSSNSTAASASTTNGGANSGDSIELSFSHTLGTASLHHELGLYLGQLMEERTNGAVTVKVYPSGQIAATEREAFEAVQMGTIDITFGGTTSLSNWVDKLLLFEVPFLIDNYEHSYAVYDSDFGKEVQTWVEDYGMISLGLVECGFYELFNKKHEAAVPADFKGLNMRTSESVAMMNFMLSLGANPITMAANETFTSLQNGVIDGMSFPILYCYTNKYYPEAKYFTEVNMLTGSTFLCTSPYTFDNLPEEYHQIFKDAAADACVWARGKLQELINVAMEDMEAEGLVVHKCTPEEKEIWRESIYSVVYPKIKEASGLGDELDTYVERIRAVAPQ